MEGITQNQEHEAVAEQIITQIFPEMQKAILEGPHFNDLFTEDQEVIRPFIDDAIKNRIRLLVQEGLDQPLDIIPKLLKDSDNDIISELYDAHIRES